MPPSIQLAAPPTLSARPLVYGLEGAGEVSLRWEPWSTMPAVLRSGEVDAALLPSIDYPRLVGDAERARTHTGSGPAAPRHFVILPVPAITSRGAVGGLRLIGYADKDKLRRVLLDPASPTGSAMARLVVLRQFGARPHFVMPDDMKSPAARRPDAELLVGARALAADPPAAQWGLDLGAEWHSTRYLPMVYAMWVARADGPVERLEEILAEAAAKGLAAREAIVAEAAAKSKLPAEVIHRFLFDQTRYAFGAKEEQGLEAFLTMAAEEGLAPEGVRLRLGRV